MESLMTLQRRLNWTRGWLNTFAASSSDTVDDFEYISDANDDSGTSDYGVQSLSSGVPQSEFYESSQNHQDAGSALTHHDCGGGKCPPCTEARFAREGRKYCWICNGNCANFTSKTFPEDLPDFESEWKTSRTNVISYEIARRTTNHTFQDLRSASKARKRGRREREKYFHFKAVKPGWLERPFYASESLHPLAYFDVPLHNAPVETMTKAMMYREAQFYPKTPQRHHREPYKSRWPFDQRVQRRIEERKHASQREEHDVCQFRQEAERLKLDPNMWTGSGWAWEADVVAEACENLWIKQKDYDWCDICDVHWTNCVGRHTCVVDQVSQLRFEMTEGSRDWKLSFEVCPQDTERANRAPATIPYGKRDWVLHRYPEHYTDDDVYS